MLGGIVLIALGSIIGSFGFGAAGGTIALYGGIGALLGILVIVGGVMMWVRPQQHVIWGVLVIVFAVISIPLGGGGFILGFILALIGGILGLVFKPTPTMMGGPGMMPGAMGAPGVMTCPACGGAVNMQTRTCTMCGKAV
jgi:hypothetical protein